MSVSAVIVTFENDVSEDFAESLRTAIRHFKGVLDVSAVPANLDIHIAERRVRTELGAKLFKILYPTTKGST